MSDISCTRRPEWAGCFTKGVKNFMTGDARLINRVVLVHAYTVSDDKKHRVALGLIERVWAGEAATTTLQNLCEFFFVCLCFSACVSS